MWRSGSETPGRVPGWRLLTLMRSRGCSRWKKDGLAHGFFCTGGNLFAELVSMVARRNECRGDSRRGRGRLRARPARSSSPHLEQAMRLLAIVAMWSGCACLLFHASPLHPHLPSAHAQSKVDTKRAAPAKSVRRCMTFKQSMGKDLESVDLRLTSRCKFEVVCSIEYQLVCSPETSEAAEINKNSSRLDFQDSWNVSASASSCEADWEIQNVRWSCTASES